MGRAWANRTFIIILMAAIGCLLITALVVLLGLTSIGKLRLEHGRLRSDLVQTKQAVDQADTEALERRVEDVDRALEALEPELAPVSYVPTLLLQIEMLALSTDNDLQETRPGEYRKGIVVSQSADDDEETGGQRYNELDMQFRFAGSYHTAFEFIRRLGSMRKMILVRNVACRKDATLARRGDSRYSVDVMLEMTAYVLELDTATFPAQLDPFRVHEG
jgi:Tfp pilus assembly protein PilO